MDIYSKKGYVPATITVGSGYNLEEINTLHRVLKAVETCEPPKGKIRLMKALRNDVLPIWTKHFDALLESLSQEDRHHLLRLVTNSDNPTPDLKDYIKVFINESLSNEPIMTLTVSLVEIAFTEDNPPNWLLECKEALLSWAKRYHIEVRAEDFRGLSKKANGLRNQYRNDDMGALLEYSKTIGKMRRCFPIPFYQSAIDMLLNWYAHPDAPSVTAELEAELLSDRAGELYAMYQSDPLKPLEIKNDLDWVWNPLDELLETFNKRVTANINEQIKAYTSTIKESPHYLPIKESRASYHYKWFVLYQFYGLNLLQIAQLYKDKSHRKTTDYKIPDRRLGDIKERILKIAKELGIEPR